MSKKWYSYFVSVDPPAGEPAEADDSSTASPAPVSAAQAVADIAEASGAPLEDVIQDAVRRDRALDTFERVQEKSVAELEARKTQENQQIQTEMDRVTAEYRARIQANNDAVAKEKERFYGWRLKKQEEEQKISEAVSYFVTVNPITTGGSAAAPAPSNASQK